MSERKKPGIISQSDLDNLSAQKDGMVESQDGFKTSRVFFDIFFGPDKKAFTDDGSIEYRKLYLVGKNKSSHCIAWMVVEPIVGFYVNRFGNQIDHSSPKGVHVDWIRQKCRFTEIKPGDVFEFQSNVDVMKAKGREIPPQVYQFYGQLKSGERFHERLFPTELEFGESDTAGEKQGCCLMTAAYGTPSHPVLDEFREFRDNVLKRVPAGNLIINWYYNCSPSMASFIADKPVLKASIRSVLYPLATCTRANNLQQSWRFG